MSYLLRLSKKAEKQLSKLDRGIAKMLLNWLVKNIDGCDNPRFTGKALKGKLCDYWRYRLGAYRIICDIRDDAMVVLVISVADRKDAYKG